jgi:hypothetical protein
MTLRWAKPAASLLLTLGLVPGSMQAQKGLEGGVHAIATFADFDFAGGGVHLGFRPGGRTRFSLSASAGGIDGAFAARGEGTAQFMLNPGSRKAGFYAGGGIAGLTGPVDEAYVLLLFGVEASPGGGSGWVLETGIGGGVRVLLGYRWRRLRR